MSRLELIWTISAALVVGAGLGLTPLTPWAAAASMAAFLAWAGWLVSRLRW